MRKLAVGPEIGPEACSHRLVVPAVGHVRAGLRVPAAATRPATIPGADRQARGRNRIQMLGPDPYIPVDLTALSFIIEGTGPARADSAAPARRAERKGAEPMVGAGRNPSKGGDEKRRRSCAPGLLAPRAGGRRRAGGAGWQKRWMWKQSLWATQQGAM